MLNIPEDLIGFRRLGQVSLLLTAILLGCGDPPPQGGGKRQKPAHLVEIAEAKREPLVLDLDRTGTLKVSREVRVFNQVDGRLEQVVPSEGDRIRKGDLLVLLERDLLKAELEKASAQRKQDELSLKRLRSLKRQRLTSEDEIARAQTAVEVAKAEERLLNIRLGYATINAPFDGIISARLMEPGDVAPRHSHILTLIDPASLFTEVAVSELLLPALKVGDAVTIRIDALGGRAYAGQIQRIHPTVDSRTRLGQVEVALKPVPEGAHAGQLCRVRLTGTATERLSIPFSAIRRDTQGGYVYVINEQGKVDQRRVGTGLRVADQIEIVDGLVRGELVVTRGFLGLSPGKSVKIVGQGEQQPIKAAVQ